MEMKKEMSNTCFSLMMLIHIKINSKLLEKELNQLIVQQIKNGLVTVNCLNCCIRLKLKSRKIVSDCWSSSKIMIFLEKEACLLRNLEVFFMLKIFI